MTQIVISCQAAYHGVPVVAMPFFADQPLNTMKAVSKVQDTQSGSYYHRLDPFTLWENYC